MNVEDGVPVVHECPANGYQAGACKHRVAVAIRKPVLDATTDDDTEATNTEPETATDGGLTVVGFDTDAEMSIETDNPDKKAGEDTKALHALALDAYEADPLPDFDIYQEIVACSHSALMRAVTRACVLV